METFVKSCHIKCHVSLSTCYDRHENNKNKFYGVRMDDQHIQSKWSLFFGLFRGCFKIHSCCVAVFFNTLDKMQIRHIYCICPVRLARKVVHQKEPVALQISSSINFWSFKEYRTLLNWTAQFLIISKKYFMIVFTKCLYKPSIDYLTQ